MLLHEFYASNWKFYVSRWTMKNDKIGYTVYVSLKGNFIYKCLKFCLLV